MSDEEKKEEEGGPGAWSAEWPDSLEGLMGMTDDILDVQAIMSQVKGRKLVPAIDLSPGDIIQVGYVTVFIVGVRYQELEKPTKGGVSSISVEVAGAECWYAQNDWHWMSKNIQYDSPFLRFKPDERLELVRESPNKTSTLDRLLEIRTKAREKLAKTPNPVKSKSEEPDAP